MTPLYVGLCAITAYLLGSIPTAIWYGEAYHGIDIRQHGSGNAGATNTFRVLGKKAGIYVILIDVLKGWVGTSLSSGLFYLHELDTPDSVRWKLIFGILAVLGHVFPFWAGFKGGKGVATLLGMIIALHPAAAGSCLAIFWIVFLATNYVSLASMLASISFPLMIVVELFGQENPMVVWFGVVMCGLVIVTHRKNIIRLAQGNESKIYLFGKREQEA